MKKAKRKYFSENLDANKSDPRKTWWLISELQSRQSKSTKVSQVKTGNQDYTSPGNIAFDTVDHNILLRKLYCYGVNGNACLLYTSDAADE